MRRGKTLVLVLSSLALGTAAQAVMDSSGGPYHGIVERNVFNLRPPPPPPDPNAIAIQQAPKLTLTGITTILGNKRALITVPVTRPGQPPESLMLAEGQSQDDVLVMEINELAGTVKVKNHGVEQTLDFLNNGAKPMPGPAPNPMSVPPPMAAPMPGNVMPTAPHPASTVTPLKSLPQRTLRLPGAPNSGGSAMGTAAGVSAANNQSEQSLTAEEQAALIYLNKKKYEAEGNPMAKIMPPVKGIDDEEDAPPAP